MIAKIQLEEFESKPVLASEGAQQTCYDPVRRRRFRRSVSHFWMGSLHSPSSRSHDDRLMQPSPNGSQRLPTAPKRSFQLRTFPDVRLMVIELDPLHTSRRWFSPSALPGQGTWGQGFGLESGGALCHFGQLRQRGGARPDLANAVATQWPTEPNRCCARCLSVCHQRAGGNNKPQLTWLVRLGPRIDA